jgi:hypothetical protein
VIYVKYYDKKSESSEITHFSYNYEPTDQISIKELINTWVSANLGHNLFEIKGWEFELPEKCE